jgi:hypothetical protein
MAFRFVQEEPPEIDQQTKRYRFVEEEEPKKMPENLPGGEAPWYEKFGKALSLQSQNAPQPQSIPTLTKSGLSGSTLGYSELIPGLKLSEEEKEKYPDLVSLGETTGELGSIGAISKGVKWGLGTAYKLGKDAPKILKYLDTFAHGFGTGSIYEGGKQSKNALADEETDLSKIPRTGAMFGAFNTLLHGASDLLKNKFSKISPTQQAKILEQGIIPEDLPKSQYETAEEMLKHVQDLKKKNSLPRFPPDGRGGNPPPGAPPALDNRVSASGKDLGLKPIPYKFNANLNDQVRSVFSPNKFYNTTQGGQAFRNEIMDIDQNVYRGVNELYKVSRDLNTKIDEIHPYLVDKLKSNVDHLKSIPEPSDVQKRLLRASSNILKDLAEYQNITDGAGNVIGKEISGYKPINNQTLIDQVQSLRQIIDYDFSHGNTKNIFRPLINDLQDAALKAAESSGTPEAAKAINDAKSAYRMWVEAFDNDYVRPFRDSSNQDYSKLYKSALDLDESNMLKRILNTTPRGKELIDASTSDIVEKHLGKFFDNPRNVTTREFDTALRELEAVITPDQANEVKTLFKEQAKNINFKAKLSNEEIIASKYLDKKPEDIQKLMNSRTGIKQLREDFSKSPQKKELFDTLSKQKMRSILRKGNIENEFTGDDLYTFFNKESNYEIFSEILGEAETEALRQSAKEIGKAQVKSEALKQKLSKITNKVISLKTLHFIFGMP